MEEVVAAPIEVAPEPEPVAAPVKATAAKAAPKKGGKKGKAAESAGVALLDPPSIEIAEEAVAQGLAVVRPPDPEVAEPALRSLGLQAEIDSLRAQQGEWEQNRKAWEQERSQLIAERDLVESLRRSWDEERGQLEQARLSWEAERAQLVSERDLDEQLRESWADERTSLQDKAAELELELELTQKQLADVQSSSGDLQTRLNSAEQEAADELKQITALQDEMAETSRRLELREGEMEQWSRRLGELQASLDEVRETESNLRLEMEELELLKEDLEETIVERRRELKALRASESEARAYAEECKGIREGAEAEIAAAQNELVSYRQTHQDELSSLGSRLAAALQREEELKQVAGSANQEAVKEAERRHLEAERRLIEVNSELDSLRRDGSDRERLERKCLLLENDLKAANQELMTLERAQSRLETEKQQLAEELEKVKAGSGGPVLAAAAAGAGDEAEIKQWKIRADDLRESLRKQRTENERLQERVDVLIKAKELEEKQRKEVESRLRTALRIQARQQGGF